MDQLTPEQTREFRGAQKKRSRIILFLILGWIIGIFTLTLVKGHIAVQQRDAQLETHE